MNTNFAINVKQFADKNFMTLEESHSYIQPELFKLGYHWPFANSISEIKHTTKEILYINKDMSLQFSSIHYYEKEEVKNYPLGSINAKRQMVVEVIPPKTHIHLNGTYTKEALLKMIEELGNA